MCHDETAAKRPAKEAARTALVAALKTKLTAFVAALKIGPLAPRSVGGPEARPACLTTVTVSFLTEFASKVLLPTKDQATGKGPDGASPSPVATPVPATAAAAPAPAPAPKAAAKATGVTVKLEVDLLAR